MTTTPPAPPESARELVTMPEPARGSARDARELLEEPRQEAGQQGAGDGVPFTIEGQEQNGRRRRKGGHKPTKVELEEQLAEARRQLATVTGERPAAEAEAEAGLRAALGGTFGAVFNVAAGGRGSHWRLESAEEEKLAGAWAPVLAPYMAGSAEYLPWVLAAGVTYQVLEPRLRLDAARASGQAIDVTPAPASSSSSRASSPPRPAGPRDPGAVSSDLRTPPLDDTLSDAPHLTDASRRERPLDPPAPIQSRGAA